jgi:hypothetical protein
MKIEVLVAMGVAVLAAGCPSKPEMKKRAELRTTGGNTMEVIPAEGQLPYCLVFTISETKVVRQLTMNRANLSVPCEAGKPIGQVSFRVPKEEGKVKVLVFFSDRKLNAGSVAQQIYELTADGKTFYAYDLRLPGDVKTESIEFEPKDEAPVVEGNVVSGAIPSVDGGSPMPPPAEDAGMAAAPAPTPPAPVPAVSSDSK